MFRSIPAICRSDWPFTYIRQLISWQCNVNEFGPFINLVILRSSAFGSNIINLFYIYQLLIFLLFPIQTKLFLSVLTSLIILTCLPIIQEVRHYYLLTLSARTITISKLFACHWLTLSSFLHSTFHYR